ncbi:MAG: hypothetical protein GY906_23435 [bacterium]|nr:hypothetical protein [bacterium]
MTKNEVTKWEPTTFEGQDLLPVALGEKEVDQTGRENVESEDLILPSLMVLQGQSDPVLQGVEGARPGLFFLGGAEEVFASPIRLLFCAHTKSRALFPKADRPEHAGLEECISRDAVAGSRYGDCETCPHAEWGEDNRRPACSESHNFTALTPYGPAVMRFSGSSIKGARKKILTPWTMSPDTIWSHPVTVVSKAKTEKINGKDTTYFVMEPKWHQREDVPSHVQDAARAVYEQVTTAHEAGKFGMEGQFEDK